MKTKSSRTNLFQHYFFFNAILGQESLWLISSQWKSFQNSKSKACIGNIDRDLIITLKICHSAAQGMYIKQITSKWKIREASKIKAKLMIVTVLFALRPFCDNKRYIFFFFWTGCNHLHSSLWNTNYVFKLYHLILKYFNFTDRILSGATAWQSSLYGSFGISKKTKLFFFNWQT